MYGVAQGLVEFVNLPDRRSIQLARGHERPKCVGPLSGFTMGHRSNCAGAWRCEIVCLWHRLFRLVSTALLVKVLTSFVLAHCPPFLTLVVHLVMPCYRAWSTRHAVVIDVSAVSHLTMTCTNKASASHLRELVMTRGKPNSGVLVTPEAIAG